MRLENGRELRASKAVVSSLDPRQTFLKLIDPQWLDVATIRMAKSFSFGNIGVFRSHYALDEPPRFRNGDDISATSFQRIFYSVADTRAHYADIAMGIPPRNPFLWTACWTLTDPSRAPDGKHTLIIDTFVPNMLRDGTCWEDIKHDFAGRLLAKLREYTTNMSSRWRPISTRTPSLSTSISGRHCGGRESTTPAKATWCWCARTGSSYTSTRIPRVKKPTSATCSTPLTLRPRPFA